MAKDDGMRSVGYTPGPWAVDPLDIGARWNVGTKAQDVGIASEVVSDPRHKQRGANARLFSLAPRMERMLRRLEWSAGEDRDLCPVCHGWRDAGRGHAPDCELAALLRDLPEPADTGDSHE